MGLRYKKQTRRPIIQNSPNLKQNRYELCKLHFLRPTDFLK